MTKLAIITSHPIQYNAPLFRLLAKRMQIQIKVFYTWGDEVLKNKYDPGFKKNIEWDVPLLDGYDYTFVKNSAKDKGTHHFAGINNPTLINEILSWNANAILVFGWAFKSHLKVIRYFHGKIPVYFRGDSTLIGENQSSLFKTIVRQLFLRWVYKKIDRAFYVGTNNKEYFLKMGLHENQLIFSPHCIDNDKYANTSLMDLRDELNIDRNAKVVLFAGKLQKIKDPFLLLSAFQKLKNNNLHLLFVGNGELENELKYKVSILPSHIQSQITFLDFVNQSKMPRIYKTCDVFVLPSKSETWGLAINEAMACGKAVVASSKCGCAIDLIEQGGNGFIFEAGNENDLIFKLNSLFSKNNISNIMGVRSSEIIERWNYNSIAQSIELEINQNHIL